jgi:hypothetical protein
VEEILSGRSVLIMSDITRQGSVRAVDVPPKFYPAMSGVRWVVAASAAMVEKVAA